MKYYNRSAIAKAFSVSLTTIDSWIRRGMPYVESPDCGKGGWQFDLEAVKRWRENQNYPRHSNTYAEDDGFKPAVAFGNAAVIDYSLWLAKELKIDSEKMKKVAFKWFRNKTEHIISMEDTLNDWMMNKR